MSTQELMTVMRSFGETLQASLLALICFQFKPVSSNPDAQDDEVDEMLKAASSCEVKPGHVDYRQLAKVLLK
jgi:hypothetical protein